MTSRPGIVAATAAAVVALSVGVVAFVDRGSDGHELTTVVPSAGHLITGQQIRIGPSAIGDVRKIEPVDHGRAARVTLRISDADYWPLPVDTRWEIRFGGSVSYGNRYIALKPGKDTAHVIPDHWVIPARNVTVPVEVDELIALFKRPLRHDLKRFVDTAGPAFNEARPSLGRGLEVAPGVIGSASGVLRDLSLDQDTLSSLVRSTHSVIGAVDRSSPRLSALLDGAASTFSAVADENERLKTALERTPATLDQVQKTLPRADATLTAAAALTRELAPGVARLRRISAPLNRLLGTLEDVGPDARGTLTVARRDAPGITRLLDRATTVSPRLESIGHKATKELDCIRPYTPEIVNLTTTWSDFMTPTDGHDRYIRANIQNFLPAPYNNVPLTPAQLAKIHPWVKYGFPRPPGALADQPWFQPQCGAGPNALDPAKDQEAKTFVANRAPARRSGK